MSGKRGVLERRHVARPGGEEELFNRALGRSLRAARTDAAVTQDALANQVGLTRGSIANIERGEQSPGLYRLLLLCSALDKDLDELVPSLSFAAEDVAGTLSDNYASIVGSVLGEDAALGTDDRTAP